ncbi:NrfD/PsrC family molybdoenzyme membrane anchor subunit [Salipaludibacillus sp. HK11]|uniref:NrfD/PsrC family molybdoenzyme membrane anchor subunit n=1 Tax=Salipaludibacillus sp. HK11 TaxID=3394320 RepID=UPI0039FD0D2B
MAVKWQGKSLIAVVILLLIVATGIYGMGNTLIRGQVVFGSTDYVPWNLLIVAYVFLALMASGMCMLASASHVLGFKKFDFLGKRAIFLALAVLIPGLLVLAMDLGRLDRAYLFITSPNLQAPMWWMGATYGVYVVLLVVEFVAMHNKNEKVMHYASYLTLAGAIAATSILGGIFAIVVQRPLWYGGATSVFFALSALMTGIACLTIFTYFTYKFINKQLPRKVDEALIDLSKLMGILIGVALGFNAWRLITMFYTGTPDFSLIFNGEYALMYWGGALLLGLIIPLMIIISKRTSVIAVGVSFLVLFGMFFDKFVTVIGGQLAQPYGEMATYTATVTEWLIFVGAMAATVVVYMIGTKIFNLSESTHEEKDKKTTKKKIQPSAI